MSNIYAGGELINSMVETEAHQLSRLSAVLTILGYQDDSEEVQKLNRRVDRLNRIRDFIGEANVTEKMIVDYFNN